MPEKQPLKAKKRRRIVLYIVFSLLFLLAAALFSVSVWYKSTFDVSFTDLLATILSPLEGTGENTRKQILSSSLPPVLPLFALYIMALILLRGETPKRILARRIGAIACAAAFVFSLIFSAFAFGLPEYLKNTFIPTTIYENEYINPDSVKITDENGDARNLIYIYLESMETTYASGEVGGNQENTNYIPNLTALASEHTSFSDGEGLGGFRSINGTGWTMGALMGSTSGVPFSLAVYGKQSHNSQGKNGEFANGLVTLGDILAEKGYTQEFLCGSDGKFAGRSTYFTVHGNYKIFDYNTAIEKGYIPEDRYVFWGLEDEILFRIAKDEITALAAEEKPFHFSMLTVDAHHVGGYVCGLCQNEYTEPLANVISCQDRQIASFIEWCKTQDFYENTTIVIVGDHPRMDKILIGEELEIHERTMYNCIINGTKDAENTKNRVFTTLDLFPTVLSAMGFEIEGDRLGLGVDLYSTTPTLCEQFGEELSGYHFLDTELGKRSPYYKKNFVN